MKDRIISVFGSFMYKLGLALSFVMLFSCSAYSGSPLFYYTMVDVNTGGQGDAHLIYVPGGKTVLIDTGDADQAESELVPYLLENGITVIDYLFISHIHADHYGGIRALVQSGINIINIYYDKIPDLQDICYRDCCCDYEHFLWEINGLGTTDIKLGQRFRLSDGIRLDVLDLWAPGDSESDINDTSSLLKLSTNNFSVLFTGDLNFRRSMRLAYSDKIKADILKVPHHGAESLASDMFLNSVYAKVFLVPAPEWLWNSDRALRVRNNPTDVKFANGIDGHVVVSVYRDKYEINSSNGRTFISRLKNSDISQIINLLLLDKR